MLKILNSLTGDKEEFIPINKNEVLMYVCGITPYSDSHVGHGMSYVIFDVMKRYLTHKGYQVRHIQNFTDVDDKIIQRANENQTNSSDLSKSFIDAYFEDMALLGVKDANEYPLATEEISGIIEMIEGLIEKGFAYESQGDVYFRVDSFADYGKLSNRSLDGMIAGSRIAVSEAKENPLDFTLWKSSKPEEPSWPSPWGAGRPGWHIECSAMSLSYLGKSLDIHGGGADLLFPHHENEIAQSEAFTGEKPFSKYWIHHGLLQLGSEKMSKSIGNLVTIKDAVSTYGRDAFRIFVLGSHYRNPLTWSEEALLAARTAAARLERAVNGVSNSENPANTFEDGTYRDRFTEAMDDDFNTPQALAVLFDLSRDLNRADQNGEDVRKARELVRYLADILGLELSSDKTLDAELEPFIELLLDSRNRLRAQNNYELADFIRDSLENLGVSIEDSKTETKWNFQSRN
ncbi:MAG: cysteine--tRNA ligase [Chloroflexota bacterium]|nr:cysteine--tRNA ligase [Chloroflexota bacterium]